MDVERLVVRLVADASQYTGVLNAAENRLFAFATMVTEQVGRVAFDISMQLERAAVAFEVMFKSAEKGQDTLDRLVKMATETPFHTTELVKAGKMLAAFGFEADEVERTLYSLGEAAAATGTPLDRIVLAFGQVRTAGRLLGQELRQFTNAGIPMAEMLAAVTGKPETTIRKMVREGQIGFSDVAAAFNKMTTDGGLFAGMMDRVNRTTLSGRWENFTESLQIMSGRFADGVVQGLRLKDVLGDITNSLQLSKEEQKAYIAQVAQFFEAVRTAAMQVWDMSKGVRDWIKANQDAIRIMAGVIILLTAFNIAVATGARGLNAIRTLVVFLLNPFRLIAVAVASVVTSVVSLVAGFIAWIGPISLVVGGLTAVIGILDYFNAFDGVLKELTLGFDRLLEVASRAAEGIVNALKVGDLKLAWDIAMKGLEIAWNQTLENLTAAWIRFKNNLVTNVSKKAEELSVKLSFATHGDGGRLDRELKAIREKYDAQDNAEIEEMRTANRSNMEALNRSFAELTESARVAAKTMELLGGRGYKEVEKLVGGDLTKFLPQEGDKIRKEISDLTAGIAEQRAKLTGLPLTADEWTVHVKTLFARLTADADRASVEYDKALKATGRPDFALFQKASAARQAMLDFEERYFAANGSVRQDLNPYTGIGDQVQLQIMKLAGRKFGLERSLGTDFLAKARADIKLPFASSGSLFEAVLGEAYRMKVQDAAQTVAVVQQMLRDNKPDAEIRPFADKAQEATRALETFTKMLVWSTTKIGQGVNVPYEVSVDAQRRAEKLVLEYEKGTNPLDFFRKEVRDITEAFQGPTALVEMQKTFADNGAPDFLTDMIETARKQKSLISSDEQDFGLFKAFEGLKKQIGDKTSPVLPPTLYAGTSQAMDAINRANQDDINVQQEILRVLTVANELKQAEINRLDEVAREIKNVGGNEPVEKRRIGGGR